MTGHRINFSDREQDYITANAPHRCSWGSLARDLERMFPEDNQGRRGGKTVRNWYRAWLRRKEEMVEISAAVPANLAAEIKVRGLTPAEVGQILVNGLKPKALT